MKETRKFWLYRSVKGGWLAIGAMLMLVSPLFGQVNLEWVERSEPEGVFATETRYIETGTEATTRTAAFSASGYQFVEWQINGVAQRDALGVSENPARATVTAPVAAVALYVDAAQDTEGAGVTDGVKGYWYDDVNVSATSDTDGDGFTFAEELARGYHPKVADTIEEGGIAGRRSEAVVVLTDLTKARFVQRSDPQVFTPVESFVDQGTQQTLTTAPVSGSGYRFIGWFLGETRIDSSTLPPPYTITIDATSVEVVARYVLESADNDLDAVPDWQEFFYYDSLDTLAGPVTDTDADGFGFAEELSRGYQPVHADAIDEGGIAGRRSEAVVVLTDLTLSRFVQRSDPQVFAEVASWEDIGTEVTLLTPPAQQSGYHFIGWFRDGVRLENSTLPPPYTVNIDTTSVEVVARYVASFADNDLDDVPDWQEFFYHDGLDTLTGPESDTDADGFGFADELARGYQPLYADTIEEGGIAGRRSGAVTILQLPSIQVWGDTSMEQNAVPWALSGKRVTAIAAGAYHSLALEENGTVHAWGDNSSGQGRAPRLDLPAVAIAAGEAHSLAVLEDGSVVGWGRNTFGEASPPSFIKDAVAVAAGVSHSMALTADGSIYCWGDNAYGQVVVPHLGQAAVAIAAGDHFSLALLADGSLVGWGRNQAGQLDFVAAGPYTQIATGARHTLALGQDGAVDAWGDASDGQLAVPADLGSASAVRDIAAGSAHSLALLEDGTVVAWGRSDVQQATVPDGLGEVVAMEAGAAHSLVVQSVVNDPNNAETLYRLTVLPSRRGGILRTPFKRFYNGTETITLTAVPRPGFVFTGWTGDLAGSDNPLTFTLSSDATVGATFAFAGLGAWEATHFGAMGSGPATIQKGGRPVSLETAYLLGEDPANPFDIVRLEARRAARGPLLRFRALQGRRYQVERSFSLTSDSWQAVGTPFIGEGDTVEIPYTPEPSGPAFYRLNISLPPDD